MNYVLNFGAVLRGFDDLLSGLALGLVMGLAGLAAGSLIGIVAASLRCSAAGRRGLW
jgi:F0F1-type ATP synthase membrane subunit c/vacuolar-type H+-ATPase subunit K